MNSLCLFTSQRNHWINFHSAASRHIAREEGNQHQQKRDTRERRGIGGTDAEKQTRRQVSNQKRQHQAYHQSDEHQDDPLPDNQPEYVTACASQRGPYAYFASPLRHGVDIIP